MSKTSGDYSASHWLEVLRTTEIADRRWKKAVKSLTEMGLRAVPALIEAEGDDNQTVCIGASKALQQIGPATVPFLIKALRHENPRIREIAARGLYGHAPNAQKAISALTDALQDSDAFVRKWIAVALEALAYHFGPILKVAVPGLSDLLKDEDWAVREWAAHALGSIGTVADAALPALQSALEDEEPVVRQAAAEALSKIQKS